MQRALIAHPTEIVRPAPFTAESIWPAMMDAIIPPKTRQCCQFEEAKVKNQNMIKEVVAFKTWNAWCTQEVKTQTLLTAHLKYHIEQAGDFGRPISHKVST